MEKKRSEDDVILKRYSSSDNLPVISSNPGGVLPTQSETATECRFPPIMRPDRGYRRRREPSGWHEKLNYRGSGEFFDHRRTMPDLGEEVPNRKDKKGRGPKRSDVKTVSSGQKTEHVPHSPTSLDAKRPRERKTTFQRRNSSLSYPASENVIIEEIYLLPQRKKADSMTKKSQRQEIRDHLPLRDTRSDGSGELSGIRCCGEILSRRVCYSDCSINDSSRLLFGRNEIDTRGAMTNEVRAAHLRNSPHFLYRENKHGARTEDKVHPEAETEWEQLGANGQQQQQQQQQQQGPSQLHQENMSESFSRAEASNQDRFSASYHQSPGIVHGKSVVAEDLNGAKDNEKEHSACCVTDRTGRMRRYGVYEARTEAQCKEVEYSVGYSTDKSEESQAHQEFCEGSDEATDKEKERLVRPTSDESGEREMRRQRDATQMQCQRGCAAKDEATDEDREYSTSPATDEPAEGRQGQQMRRQGVCEAVDNTAARRRRARVLKKKLFGDDPPIHDELMTQEVLRRGLNKRL